MGSRRQLGLILALLLAALTALILAPASATTVYVDDSYSADDPAQHEWTTIQEGRYDAAPGETVHVYDGTYNENVTMWNDSVTLEGESRAGVVIDRQYLGSPTVSVRDHHITIRNLTVHGGYYGIDASSYL